MKIEKLTVEQYHFYLNELIKEGRERKAALSKTNG